MGCGQDSMNLYFSCSQSITRKRIDGNKEYIKAFGDLKRGRDYQLCPDKNCQRKVELKDACNHMVCPCGTNFCFISGKEADNDDEHWENVGAGAEVSEGTYTDG